VNIKQNQPQTVGKRLWLDLQSAAGVTINEATKA
jgi:hypothetical protein